MNRVLCAWHVVLDCVTGTMNRGCVCCVCVARCIELHDRFYEQRVCVLYVCGTLYWNWTVRQVLRTEGVCAVCVCVACCIELHDRFYCKVFSSVLCEVCGFG